MSLSFQILVVKVPALYSSAGRVRASVAATHLPPATAESHQESKKAKEAMERSTSKYTELHASLHDHSSRHFLHCCCPSPPWRAGTVVAWQVAAQSRHVNFLRLSANPPPSFVSITLNLPKRSPTLRQPLPSICILSFCCIPSTCLRRNDCTKTCSRCKSSPQSSMTTCILTTASTTASPGNPPLVHSQN
jgi:hypothetical protein